MNKPCVGELALGYSGVRIATRMQPLSAMSGRLGRLAVSLGATSIPIGYRVSSHEPLAPVFIIGSGRSGTTLVRRLLSEGGQLHIPPESYVMGPVIHRYLWWRYGRWESVVDRVLHAFESHPEFVRFDISLAPLRQQLAGARSPDRSLATIIDAIYRFHADRRGTGSRRWGDKTPLNTFYLPEINGVFPSARFVHVVRDGCDVVHSYIAMGRYRTIESAATRWRSSVRAARRFAARNPGTVLEARYEDLVRDPGPTIRTMYDWLGLANAAPMVRLGPELSAPDDVVALPHHARALGPIDADSIGRGRRAFDEASLLELDRLIGPTLAELGYPAAIH
jgi:protein-tyrosine sulfotransferase